MIYRFYRFLYGLVGFSRSQSNGFIVLLPILFTVICMPYFVRHHYESRPNSRLSDEQILNALVAEMRVKERTEDARPSAVSITPFDPNTASERHLIEAGVPGFLAKRIVSFRTKGGRFFRKHDLLKIYGMDSTLFFRLEPLITISETASNRGKKATRTAKMLPKNAPKTIKQQDINLADSAALREVRGIGEKLALRILKYRDALGGFVSMEQLKEVYRLDSGVVQKLASTFYVDPAFLPAKLDLNTADRKQLAVHPYITDVAANAIVAYRFQHGNFKSLEDLRRITVIDSAMYRKISPYVKLKE